MKISALPVLNAPDPNDSVPILDDSADTTKQITLSTLLGMIYPIGSLYTNASDNSNPRTLLGFGTWVATAVGRTPVGYDNSQSEFDTAGETGGEKTHTLNATEMPSHAHGVNDPGHAHAHGVDVTGGWASGTPISAGGGGATGFTPGHWSDRNGNNAGGLVKAAGSNISIQGAGGDGAHNNLQPYEVFYIWKRTA